MFVSRAITTSHAGHRCASSAKFINTRRATQDQPQVLDVEDEPHPKRSFACAFVSALFCPILGIVALFYSIRALRAYSQGYYAEAAAYNKQATRWSLITFIVGLTIDVHSQLSWYSGSQTYSSWNNGVQPNLASVRGYLLSEDAAVLPYGSQIVVSIKDISLQDVPAVGPLNSFVLYGSYRFPIAFQIPYSIAQIQQDPSGYRQYALQARIERNGQLLYINDQQIPIQLIPIPNPINIMMKKVGGSIYPGGTVNPTALPPVSGIYICQLRPDPGLCYGSFERYYFNTQLRACQTFNYGGCGGNQNRFLSRDECERACFTYRRRLMHSNAKQAPIG
ncbi:unnamed protein product [Adineta ricciae]|uniref:BPTI/Kunitz inhibitor domain-containing protein n=1 Tax=Adineta ricciae TaxID=249248 RepID=A0A813Y652_ADIRI|nr:unnamed protein product [Adineta ricciae]